MTRFYTDILTAYRHDSNLIAAKYDPEIEAIEGEIGALTARRNELVSARNVAQAQADARLAEDCHIKIDADGCCVARQGKPRKAAEPPAPLSPTAAPEPVIDAAVAEASAILAAPASDPPTAADAFVADVSEPEKTLFENGYSREEVAAMDLEERWALKATNLQRADAIKNGDGRWIEPTENEEAPF